MDLYVDLPSEVSASLISIDQESQKKLSGAPDFGLNIPEPFDDALSSQEK